MLKTSFFRQHVLNESAVVPVQKTAGMSAIMGHAGMFFSDRDGAAVLLIAVIL